MLASSHSCDTGVIVLVAGIMWQVFVDDTPAQSRWISRRELQYIQKSLQSQSLGDKKVDIMGRYSRDFRSPSDSFSGCHEEHTMASNLVVQRALVLCVSEFRSRNSGCHIAILYTNLL